MFRPGDKVICIDPSDRWLTPYKIYVVLNVSFNMLMIYADEGMVAYYYQHRFTKQNLYEIYCEKIGVI